MNIAPFFLFLIVSAAWAGPREEFDRVYGAAGPCASVRARINGLDFDSVRLPENEGIVEVMIEPRNGAVYLEYERFKDRSLNLSNRAYFYEASIEGARLGRSVLCADEPQRCRDFARVQAANLRNLERYNAAYAGLTESEKDVVRCAHAIMDAFAVFRGY